MKRFFLPAISPPPQQNGYTSTVYKHGHIVLLCNREVRTVFGDNLKKYRIQKGYSQSDLAEHLFVTRQCVSKWEKGVTQPDLQTLQQISKILDISLDVLINDGSKNTDKTSINTILLAVNLLTALFCFVAFVVLWRFMPDTIPAHWTGYTVDRYGSRNEIFYHLVSVITFMGGDLLIFFIFHRNDNKTASIISHTTILLFQIAYLVFVLVLYAENIELPNSFITCLSADILLCVSISMHPEIIKQNKVIGVRTTETLSSARVWNKTNALACYMFSSISAVIIIVNAVWKFDMPYLWHLCYIAPAAVTIVYAKLVRE